MSNLLWLLISSALANPTYKPLENQKWETCRAFSFLATTNTAEQHFVNYQYCSIDISEISFAFIERELVNSTKEVFQFANSVGVSGSECVQNQNLEIYHISVEDLNSLKFPDLKITDGSKLWGLYDPRVAEKDISTILITDQNEKTRQVFAHELSHYWYDRLCWNKTWSGNEEDFARAFENYFVKSKGK